MSEREDEEQRKWDKLDIKKREENEAREAIVSHERRKNMKRKTRA